MKRSVATVAWVVIVAMNAAMLAVLLTTDLLRTVVASMRPTTAGVWLAGGAVE